jgi:hypothetical protein
VILGAALVAVGYFGRFAQEPFPIEPTPKSDGTPQVERVYEVSEVRKERINLRDKRISIIGAVYAGPGQQYFLIPDDEQSMRPDRLPPDNPIDYGIRLGGWRFRDLAEGSIYCGITVTGYFGGEVDPTWDQLAPIDSLSWSSSAPRTSEGEQ